MIELKRFNYTTNSVLKQMIENAKIKLNFDYMGSTGNTVKEKYDNIYGTMLLAADMFINKFDYYPNYVVTGFDISAMFQMRSKVAPRVKDFYRKFNLDFVACKNSRFFIFSQKIKENTDDELKHLIMFRYSPTKPLEETECAVIKIDNFII